MSEERKTGAEMPTSDQLRAEFFNALGDKEDRRGALTEVHTKIYQAITAETDGNRREALQSLLEDVERTEKQPENKETRDQVRQEAITEETSKRWVDGGFDAGGNEPRFGMYEDRGEIY